MDQLRAEATSWSLGSDKQLLNALQNLSDSVLAKTSAIQNDLERLGHESKTAELQIANAFNRLLLLANSQFIENVRLYYFYFIIHVLHWSPHSCIFVPLS